MIVAHWPPISATLCPKFSGHVNKPLKGLRSFTFNSSFCFKASFRCYCIKNENPNKISSEVCLAYFSLLVLSQSMFSDG